MDSKLDFGNDLSYVDGDLKARVPEYAFLLEKIMIDVATGAMIDATSVE